MDNLTNIHVALGVNNLGITNIITVGFDQTAVNNAAAASLRLRGWFYEEHTIERIRSLAYDYAMECQEDGRRAGSRRFLRPIVVL